MFPCLLQLSCRNCYCVEVQCLALLPSWFVFLIRKPWRKCVFRRCATSVAWAWQKRQGWSGSGVHPWGQGSLCFMAFLLTPAVSLLPWLLCTCLSGHQVSTRSTLRFSSAAPPPSGTFTGTNCLLVGSRSPAWGIVQICTNWSGSLRGMFLGQKVWRLACSTLFSDSGSIANVVA